MKKIFSVFMLMACMLCSICLSACSDDDEPAEDYYYVRYSAGINPGADVSFSFADIDGYGYIRGKRNESTVEVIVGPVKKGFKAELAVSADGHGPEWSCIDVAKGSEPFVQRCYLENGTYIYYTVGEKE